MEPILIKNIIKIVIEVTMVMTFINPRCNINSMLRPTTGARNRWYTGSTPEVDICTYRRLKLL